MGARLYVGSALTRNYNVAIAVLCGIALGVLCALFV